MSGRRICMVVNNLDVGGLEKVVLSLLEGLEDAGHEPHLVCLKGAGQMFDAVRLAPARRLVLSDTGRWQLGSRSVSLGALWQLGRFLRERRIDVVHSHNAAPLVYAGLARLLTWPRPRHVYSEHNQLYSASPTALSRFRHYVRLADWVVPVSHDLRAALERQVRRLPPMTVIHNGIDGRRFSSRSVAADRAALGLTEEDFVFGTCVVLSRQKGLPYLLEAAGTVLAAEPRCRFWVAGDGPLRTELEQRVADAGLGERFRLLGHREDVPALLSAFDAYVLPSLWEGLPLALLEALAMGKPIVCTSVGGNPEVVQHGVHGLLVPPATPLALSEALLALLHDADLRRAMSVANRERFESSFSVQAMVSAHLSLYEQLCQGLTP